MLIRLYQAECGDAARIMYSDQSGIFRNIFIDAGFERTYYSVLAEDISRLRYQGQMIDCWVLTHVHEDHIGGVLSYIDSINRKEIPDIVTRWIYNSPQKKSGKEIPAVRPGGSSTAMSFRQGDIIDDFLKMRTGFEFEDFSTASKTLHLEDLDISFLSPGNESLRKLRNLYSKRAGAMLQSEDDDISVAKAAITPDYHVKLENLANDQFKQDKSVENGSSIAIQISSGDITMLWLADSHPSVVVQALKEAGYNPANPLKCNVVQLSHHGSKFNNSPELFSMISCTNYIISANGYNNYQLPHKECLANLLLNDHRDISLPYKLYFNYDNEMLRSIFDRDGDNAFDRYNFSTVFPEDGKKYLDLRLDTP